MIGKVKKLFYFPLAYYFRFFAKIQLAIWKPKIIVVAGSSGKTTLLHLIESQLQGKAKYSHFANSSYGIPFNILGLARKKLTLDEWIYLFILAPFKAFKKPPLEKIYVVEADCDRPYEGKFLANLLRPEITLWTNVSRTHTMNFDYLVKNKRFPTVEKAIAYEFGYFLKYTNNLAIVNGDSDLIKKQTARTKASIKYVTEKELNTYKVFKDRTLFKINNINYAIKTLLSKETFYSIAMTKALLNYLNQGLRNRHSKRSASRIYQGDGRFWTSQNDGRRATSEKIKLDPSFSNFSLPPGRCSLFKGIKNTIIIDSSYNATPEAVKSIIGMFDQYPSNNKWLVLGDMIELGNEEQEEHEKLTSLIRAIKLDKIILVGPRLLKYTYPNLQSSSNRHAELVSASQKILNQVQNDNIATPRRWQAESHDSFEVDNNDRIQTFLMPKDALDYLINNLKGGETILFKGARFLEGIIEQLLVDKNDINKLCRREQVWQERRKKWGL